MMRRRFAAAVLGIEAIAVALALPVALNTGAPTGAARAFGVIAVGCLLAAGLVRKPFGFAVGWLLQVSLLGTSLAVPAVLLLAVPFAALWGTALRLGSRMDVGRA